jgi:hypothetical protein
MFGDLMMLRLFVTGAAAAALAVAALPAAAQSGGPTPKEQLGIHTGTQATNGSAVVVTDQQGTHPEGYPGMALRNRASGDNGSTHHRHHRKHHEPSEPPPG